MSIIVVTGATSGIGWQTATNLVRLGHTVVVTGRDRERGLEAVTAIGAEVAATAPDGAGRVELAVGDVSTRAAVETLAAGLLARFPAIHVLINNAGAAAPALQHTEDGLELDFAVNVAAPYRLVHALLPALRAAGHGRVVNLSGGQPGDALDTANLNAELGFAGLTTYSHSKRATEAMTLALARELAADNVTVNIVYPGQASTSMTRSVTPGMLPGVMRLAYPIFRLMTRDDGGRSAAKASRSSTWAATAEELDGVTGRSFDKHCQPAAMHASVLDEANQAKVIEAIGGRPVPAAPVPA